MEECKRTSYSYSKDGVDYRVSSEEITNGFLVCVYKSWSEGEQDKKEYKSKEKKTYYKEDPLAEKEEKESKKEEAAEGKEVMAGLKSFMSKLNPLLGK